MLKHVLYYACGTGFIFFKYIVNCCFLADSNLMYDEFYQIKDVIRMQPYVVSTKYNTKATVYILCCFVNCLNVI